MSSADFQCLMRTSFPSSLYFKSLKGIKWKKWCLIQIYLWYKAVLLHCTFCFFLLFKWKHALMCHWSTMHFYLLPDKWNEVFMFLSFLVLAKMSALWERAEPTEAMWDSLITSYSITSFTYFWLFEIEQTHLGHLLRLQSFSSVLFTIFHTH